MNPLYAALSARRLFIVYRARDKHPIDPAHAFPDSEMANSDAQNPATHMLPAVALAWAAALGAGYGVGIVISEGCGLFAIDLDGCIDGNGVISPHADAIVKQFRGAYIECSLSKKGIHIIGSYGGSMPPHKTKNHELHAELYFRRRYIALTGDLWN